MLKYRILIVLIAISFWGVVYSQNDENMPKIAVASFELLNNDMTANMPGTQYIDGNGDKSALIKIETTERGFLFDNGLLGIVAKEEQNDTHPAEIWLYVPFGTKTLNIQHPQLGSLKGIDLGQSLQKAKTYRMVLTTAEVNQLVLDYENMLPFNFDIYPPEANIFLNGVSLKKENVQQFTDTLPAGRHVYRITAEDYYPKSGTFDLNEKIENPTLKVVLDQNFGYLTIPSNPVTEGATIFVDNMAKGEVPVNQLHIKSGPHEVTINQNLYLPYTTNIEVTDSGFLVINPMLEPNFAEVEFLINDKDIIIYDNGEVIEFNGSKMQTRLEDGNHKITVKKPSHDDSMKEITVKRGENMTVSLDSPTPVYGYLTVYSNKDGATISLNGNKVGVTPMVNQRVLIGDYKVEVSNKGFKIESQNVEISRDQSKSLTFELNGWCPAYVYSKPDGATVFIDGKLAGSTPHQLNLYDGNYDIKITKDGYLPYSRHNKHFDAFTQDFTVKLRKNYIQSTEFYLQVAYNVSTLPGINVGGGLYVSNVNLEFNYTFGLTKDPTFYVNGNAEYPYTVKPSMYDVKVGYGIGLIGRLRIIPQLGTQFISLKNKFDDNYPATKEEGSEKTQAVSMSAGAKVEFILCKGIGIYLTPQYQFSINKSNYYQTISDLFSKYKNYSEGFGFCAGVKLFF